MCNTNVSNGPNSNVFYLESLNSDHLTNVNLNQYSDSISSQQNTEMPSSPNQISSQNISFINDSIFYNSSQLSSLCNMPNNQSNMYVKSEMQNANNMFNSQQQLSNSSHCTTPQTPTSIPDIILTGNFPYTIKMV